MTGARPLRARGLPLAESAHLPRHGGGRARAPPSRSPASDTIEVYDAGDQPVYRVRRGHHLAAAFYRNTIVHYFVEGSIGELAMIRAAELDVARARTASTRSGPRPPTSVACSSSTSSSSSASGSARLAAEISGRLPGWEDQLLAGVEPTVLLDKMQPLNSFAILRPFVEAYLVVARVLLADAGRRGDRPQSVRQAVPRARRAVGPAGARAQPRGGVEAHVPAGDPARRAPRAHRAGPRRAPMTARRRVRRRARRRRPPYRHRRRAHLRVGRPVARPTPVGELSVCSIRRQSTRIASAASSAVGRGGAPADSIVTWCTLPVQGNGLRYE